MSDFTEYAKSVSTALKAVSVESVMGVVRLLRTAKGQNAFVYICGNGGSAATASHFANDLTKLAHLRAMALNDLTPTVTAYGNDTKWETMYSEMLKDYLLPQDVVIGISCSGFSMNVVNAIKYAKEVKLPSVKTIALTGATWDNPLTLQKPDVTVHVPFSDIRVQEDVHLVICHAVAGVL